MKLHTLNRELSLEVFEECKEVMEVKQCYVNVFYAAQRYAHKLLAGQWKVAYGYMPSVQHYMARHCFLVNEAGEAIDPTRYTRTRLIENDEPYVSFKVFDTFPEYLKAVKKNKRVVDLLKPLSDDEMALLGSDWVRDNGKAMMRG